MKNHTDLPQSRTLAEILPLESADFHFSANQSPQGYLEKPIYGNSESADYNSFPCWSLAALLDVLESEIDDEEGNIYQLNIEKEGTLWNVWYRELYEQADPIEIESTEELVDTCVEMILKLHEKKLL